jgi:hypothetical protein
MVVVPVEKTLYRGIGSTDSVIWLYIEFRSKLQGQGKDRFKILDSPLAAGPLVPPSPAQ